MIDTFQDGIYLARNAITESQVTRLREGYFKSLEYCEKQRRHAGIEAGMDNTVHHVLFHDPIFEEILTSELNWRIVSSFFDNGYFVLNSIGGNNNKANNRNYASAIHRDVRFYTHDKLLLNTILCVSPINKETGGTELFLPKNGPQPTPPEPGESEVFVLNANPGDIFYFDSRIWHRAGEPKREVDERIIFTPIYSRPFIKPGFDYCGQLKQRNPENFSDRMKQLCSYFSDIPSNHQQWYGADGRRFYQREQDQW